LQKWQGTLFGDGAAVMRFAAVSNRIIAPDPPDDFYLE
jgi:hypothetical protein